MKISWLKSKNDKDCFKFFQNIGFPVVEIDDLDNTDNIIKDLINRNCKTIVISNEVAGFSEDIIKKYGKQDDVNIIISNK